MDSNNAPAAQARGATLEGVGELLAAAVTGACTSIEVIGGVVLVVTVATAVNGRHVRRGSVRRRRWVGGVGGRAEEEGFLWKESERRGFICSAELHRTGIGLAAAATLQRMKDQRVSVFR